MKNNLKKIENLKDEILEYFFISKIKYRFIKIIEWIVFSCIVFFRAVTSYYFLFSDFKRMLAVEKFNDKNINSNMWKILRDLLKIRGIPIEN